VADRFIAAQRRRLRPVGQATVLSIAVLLPAGSFRIPARALPLVAIDTRVGAAIDTVPGRPTFRLGPTPAGRPASGRVEWVPAQSPFGVAATSDGRLVFDLEITATALPPVNNVGDYNHYEAWLTTPKLDFIHDLGPVQNNVPVHAQVDWNKFTIIISAESAAGGRKWGSAIVLIGRSPSSLMQSFANHPLFSVPEPD
jgi:hypothetical protein